MSVHSARRGTWFAGLILASACSAVVGGCSTVQGVLVPVNETAAGASDVDMLIATTRRRAEPAEMFSGDRAPGITFANVVVSIPPDRARKIGDVQWPKKVPGNPATDFVTLKADVIQKPEAIGWLHAKVAATPKRQVLLFIHGFNNRFEDAVFRFAQIVHDSRAPVVPVLFTWPSRGSILAYGYDRESTAYSRNALEAMLTAAAKDPAVGEITILAHSMGNQLALETLRQMAIRDGRVPAKIRNVMLAAPDVDVDLAREAIIDMGPRDERPNFTLLVSQDDKALAVSKQVWGSSDRLGAINPEKEPYHSSLERAQITVIDLTKLNAGDPLNHGKFAESPEVVQLIGRRIAAGQTITDSHVGVGDRIIMMTAGTASAIGTAAGMAVAAPVAIVDPTTRENLGHHMQNLGKSTGTAE